MKTICAKGLESRALNDAIRDTGTCRVTDCLGQRFLGAGMTSGEIEIDGVPGNALGAYCNGARITVNGNAQDAVGDTMNAGKIIVRGSIGDAAGYAMRGGEIYIRDDAGYRAGIHMKEYREKIPVIVIGGCAGSFLGEYQAGGVIVVLGRNRGTRPIVGDFPCTGMHGGRLFLRGTCDGIAFPPQVTARRADDADMEAARTYIETYISLFGADADDDALLDGLYTVVTPDSRNPYRRMYVEN
ncbi:MAG: glutamate synthase [Clostridiales bacterium]|nr:glutamate synthase [Clostridiales bacterium]